MGNGKKYIDKRGWKYQVMGGIGGGIFRARYQKPNHSGATGWKSVGQLPWRLTFEEAQADLDRMACEKGWRVWEDNNV